MKRPRKSPLRRPKSFILSANKAKARIDAMTPRQLRETLLVLENIVPRPPTLQPSKIKARCAMIGLEQRDLADLAPCSRTTITNIFAGKGCRTALLERLSAAVLAEEIKRRNYLLDLHPLEAAKEAAE